MKTVKRLDEFDQLKDFMIFVKFTKAKYLDSLISGELYMSSLKTFIDIEENENGKGQGDKYEGAFVFRGKNIKIIDTETNDVIETANQGDVIERYSNVTQIPIFCFTGFRAKDFRVLFNRYNVLDCRLDIPSEERDLLKEFGDKAVILPYTFPTMLRNLAETMDLSAEVKNVEYCDYKKYDRNRRELFDTKSAEMVYWKEDFFEYQREVRFALLNKFIKDDHFDLQVSELKDKCIVMDTNKFFNDFTLSLENQTREIK